MTLHGSNPCRGMRFVSPEIPDRPSNPYSAPGSFPGIRRRRMKVTNHIHLKSRLRMSGAMSLFPLYAFIAWTGTNLFCPLWWSYAVFSCYCVIETCVWRASLSGMEAPFVIRHPRSEYNEQVDKTYRDADDYMRRRDSICGHYKPLA